MSALIAFEKLKESRASTEEKEQTKRDFSKLIAGAKASGYWAEADINEYVADIKILMGGTDEQVMALFAPGVYENAEAARLNAKLFWRTYGQA